MGKLSRSTIIRLARKLRKNPTPAEEELWAYLRNRKLNGLKFLRQHPIIVENNQGRIQFFIADFYCAIKKFIIELDGGYHNSTKFRDEQRDLILQQNGLRVYRIKNEELKDIDCVLKRIKKEIKKV